MNQLPKVVPAHRRQRGLVGCLLCLAGVELQIEPTAYQVRRMEGELERLRKHHQEQESRRAELVRERMAAMLQAVQQQRSSRGGRQD